MSLVFVTHGATATATHSPPPAPRLPPSSPPSPLWTPTRPDLLHHQAHERQTNDSSQQSMVKGRFHHNGATTCKAEGHSSEGRVSNNKRPQTVCVRSVSRKSNDSNEGHSIYIYTKTVLFFHRLLKSFLQPPCFCNRDKPKQNALLVSAAKLYDEP